MNRIQIDIQKKIKIIFAVSEQLKPMLGNFKFIKLLIVNLGKWHKIINKSQRILFHQIKCKHISPASYF